MTNVYTIQTETDLEEFQSGSTLPTKITRPTNSQGQVPSSIVTGSITSTTRPTSSSSLQVPTGSSHSYRGGQPTDSPQLTPGQAGSGDGSDGTGMTAGEVAGIAVGCAAIGAVIAGFIVFFLMRKSKRRKSRQGQASGPLTERYPSSDSGAGHELEKRPAAVFAPLGGQKSISSLANFLPPPVDTNYLGDELSTLRSLIRNHLDNFFITSPVERHLLASSIEPSAIAEIANDTPFSADEWINLLAGTTTRNNALRFIFAWVIFRRLEPECEPSKTLLPPGMNACYRHMSDYRRMLESAEKKQAGSLLQSKWRVITGYLLREQYVNRAFGEADDRASNLQETLRMLDAVVRPLGIGELDAARKDNMNEVLKRAAAIGFTLASQPSSWIFDWEPPSHGQRATPLVVFPSLIQNTNDEGQLTNTNLEIGEKELGNSIMISE